MESDDSSDETRVASPEAHQLKREGGAVDLLLRLRRDQRRHPDVRVEIDIQMIRVLKKLYL